MGARPAVPGSLLRVTSLLVDAVEDVNWPHPFLGWGSSHTLLPREGAAVLPQVEEIAQSEYAGGRGPRLREESFAPQGLLAKKKKKKNDVLNCFLTHKHICMLDTLGFQM